MVISDIALDAIIVLAKPVTRGPFNVAGISARESQCLPGQHASNSIRTGHHNLSKYPVRVSKGDTHRAAREGLRCFRVQQTFRGLVFSRVEQGHGLEGQGVHRVLPEHFLRQPQFPAGGPIRVAVGKDANGGNGHCSLDKALRGLFHRAGSIHKIVIPVGAGLFFVNFRVHRSLQ